MLSDLLMSLCLYLSYALAGHAEFTTNFFKSMRDAVVQSMTHFKNLALFWIKFSEYFPNLIG